MAHTPQPPAKPPSQPQHQPPREANRQNPPASRAGGQGETDQPLRPPLPPATSAPPRQPPPNPTPVPDEPPHDQRYDQGAFGVDRESLTPEQRTGIVTEPHPPQKFKRPLPQPGDPDYVAGQPVNEEEARRMEQVEEDRYQFAIQAAKDAEQRRMDARSDEQEGMQHPGTPGKAKPDNGEPLHKPGHHKGDDKDKK
jgi:hypothetical protein